MFPRDFPEARPTAPTFSGRPPPRSASRTPAPVSDPVELLACEVGLRSQGCLCFVPEGGDAWWRGGVTKKHEARPPHPPPGPAGWDHMRGLAEGSLAHAPEQGPSPAGLLGDLATATASGQGFSSGLAETAVDGRARACPPRPPPACPDSCRQRHPRGQLSKETRPGTGRPWPPAASSPGGEPVAPRLPGCCAPGVTWRWPAPAVRKYRHDSCF